MACLVSSIAARARGILERQRAGGTIQEVVAAVQSVVPGDLAPGDLGRKRVGGAAVVVDFDLPRRSTFRIGASVRDGGGVSGVPAACRG